ncbi:MAG: hypothetical protein ACJ701_01555 [Nitrososphaera sp.]
MLSGLATRQSSNWTGIDNFCLHDSGKMVERWNVLQRIPEKVRSMIIECFDSD